VAADAVIESLPGAESAEEASVDWKLALAAAEAEYAGRHAGSREAMARMAAWLPGGDTRSTTWFRPFPLVIDHADGVEMTDVDGHVLLDFLGNYTALVHGHRPPFILAAIEAALDRDFLFGAPMPEQGELARRIVGRLASAERVRFTNSGTEAGMVAARIARRFTGRERIALAEYSYHGSYEPLVWEAARSTGTAVFPVNDVDGAQAALDAAGPLAAVFLEPVLGSGGVIAADDDFLAFLREYTRRTGALLVFDEVMTFRLSYGGRQEATGVVPDLTMLGKIVGGGMPVGAVAGRADVLAVTDPSAPGSMEHSGTFNGHRLTMVAGAASLDALDRTAVERLNGLGDRLRDGLLDVAAASTVPISVTSCGSLLNLHAAAGVSTPAQADAAARSDLARYLHLALIDRGVFIAHRGEMCISTAMTEAVVDRAVYAVEDALAEAARLEGLA
jgi:glutamate-1-semialdehyde 2,1-aminomutase